jgi:predicted alpha/beta-hydrolase family hydrolase
MAAPAGRRKIPDDLVAIVQEAARRAERERTDPAYRAEIAEIRRKCQEGGPILGGIDGMEFQRMVRDDWPD